jgi:hypothetical protein
MPTTEVGDRLINEIEVAFTEESELPYPTGGGPVWQTGGYGFVLTMGAKVGRTPDWEFTSRPDLEGVESSDRPQILVSYNGLAN